MLAMLVILSAIFGVSAVRRWKLLMVGQPENRFDQVGERVKGLFKYAFAQWKMPKYPAAGYAHMAIFFGFMVLLLRALTLWGRGFFPEFNLFVLGPDPLFGALPLGDLYTFAKDIVVVLVTLGCVVFLYLRLLSKQTRMTKSNEAIAILGIIIVLMVSDVLYDGAAEVLYLQHTATACADGGSALCTQVSHITAPYGAALAEVEAVRWHFFPGFAGSMMAMLLQNVSPTVLVVLAHVGFWTHTTLIMVFLNILPYTKHFHVLTVIPNVYLRDLSTPGALALIGKDAEEIGEKVEKAFDEPDTAEPIGIGKLEDFSWKALLDFYTCTECGRCSDNCPAYRTDKVLSPKHLTIDLRNNLYERAAEFRGANGATAEAGDNGAEEAEDEMMGGLIPTVIDPDVIWGCTTCRACEEQCPVMISYVDKIVGMRRNLVLLQGEFPKELEMPFTGMEVQGNPWNVAQADRANWAEGLEITTAAEKPDAPVLFWVGCAAAYDDRSKKVAQAVARLLKQAGVDFVILGEEETCTGDPARRAGNEFLFAAMAEMNVATLNGYQEQGGVKTILTACPHCFNTLKHEYPAFGGKYDVVHHTTYLLDLVKQGKLAPKRQIKEKVVFHDSCYLGRYNDIYDEPREVLKRIAGIDLVEVDEANRNHGLCCGAGGTQMFMEEQNENRMNVRRTKQLMKTGADTIATACPFCMTMVTDGLKDQEKEDDYKRLDIAELLDQACGEDATS
ncbi:MAG: 4Fe-4S dicluster domain-containing protein [Deltaproteobacteria bacterium]|nr:4Fe-4S dicluster domain-containing protein [Deltaproteobacteria bacterium]MBW2255703.1 4Fe-4S dicluster domain-containing protein [Deltaproteobacteria bacterium]